MVESNIEDLTGNNDQNDGAGDDAFDKWNYKCEVATKHRSNFKQKKQLKSPFSDFMQCSKTKGYLLNHINAKYSHHYALQWQISVIPYVHNISLSMWGKISILINKIGHDSNLSGG